MLLNFVHCFAFARAKSIYNNMITLSMHEWVATAFNVHNRMYLKNFVVIVIVVIAILIQLIYAQPLR